MTALSTTKAYLNPNPNLAATGKSGLAYTPIRVNIDSETREILSMLGRTLFLLGLGTVGIVAITGKFPLFFLPLGVFLFFASCLPWRQTPRDRPAPVADNRQLPADS